MDSLITAGEAAQILGRTPRTVTRWALAGKLPPAKKLPGLTGALLFHRATVEALEAQIRVAA